MTINVPASLITKEWASTMLDLANESYRDAARQSIQFSLLLAVLTIRETFPTATHLWIDPSDQGPHMNPQYLDGPEDYEGDEDDLIENLWDEISNLEDNYPHGWWAPFVSHAERDSVALDLNLILFHYGDSRELLPEVTA